MSPSTPLSLHRQRAPALLLFPPIIAFFFSVNSRWAREGQEGLGVVGCDGHDDDEEHAVPVGEFLPFACYISLHTYQLYDHSYRNLDS